MKKICHFFRNISKPILDENTFCKIWDFLDYWIFYNVWIVTLIIIFLGITFEIVLMRTLNFLKKKLELWEDRSSYSQKQNEDIFPKGMTYESWSISRTSSMERVETFSRSIPSNPPSEEIRYNTIERTILSDEYEFQRSHFCESHASSGGTNTSLSMFHSKVKNIFMSSFHIKDPPSEYQTVQFSSHNLCSTMKTNCTKTSVPDALNLQHTFTRAKDLHVAPSPPVHFFLSSDQIRHVEENVRRKIPVNPKARSWTEAECLYPRAQEPLIHSHYSHNEGVIPGEVRTTFPDQRAMQNLLIHEAQCPSQTQQFIRDQDSEGSQPGFSEPAYFLRLPLSSSAQNSVQARQIDHENKSQHFNHTPCTVETEYSTKGIESAEHFSKTQNSVYFNDQNKSNHLVKGQNSVFQNAEFLSLNSNLLAEAMAQQKVAPGQQPLASLESYQYDAYGSMPFSPTIKSQRNGRKTPGNERKVSLRVLPPKAKQTSPSRVFPIIVSRTSENKIELRHKKKKRAHQRKIMSDIAFYLISVSKLITPHDKTYFSKCLVAVIPDLIKCEHCVQKSLDKEKINYTNSNDTVRLGTFQNTEHSFMVNTPELAAPCSFDLNIPKHEGLSGVISESAQKDASFPQIGSNREMKVQKDIETTENGEKLAVGTAAIQKCFSKDSVQNTKNSGEIILNFPDISLLISLGSQKHEENEFKDINVQVTIEYGSPSESEKPKCDTRSNKTNRHQDERKSDTYRNTTHATISQPFDMEMCNKLKANAGTLTINCNHTALKQEELLDEKKIQEVKHIDKSSILRKPQEWDSEEEGKRREPVRPLAEAFRVSICLKQKDKYAHFEMEPIQSGKRKIQSTKKEIQSQTISTQTVWETGPCQIQSLTNPIQVEQVKQRTDKPPDRDKDASPVHPVLMPENSPAGEYLIETTRYKAPFCGKATKPPDNHITEDKENLKKDLCAVTTGPFKVRKKSSGPKNVLSVKHKIIKVKKPAFSSRLSITARDTLNHKRKVGDSFESLIKQALHDVTLATVLLNVHPQGSSIHRNKINIKITPPKTQVEKKEKNLDSLNKESKTVDTLEVQLCRGVKLVEQVLSETVAHVKRNHRCDAHPVKEIKMEKELFQGVSSTEAIRESVDSLRMDSFCVANTKPGTSTRSELQYSAELKLGPQTLEKLLTGDPLVQSRERNVPSSKNDTREISCGFTQKASSCSLNSVLTHSKMKKSQTRFTNKSTTLRLKYMNKVKPPASKTLSTTGNKKNPKLDLKTILERINHAKSFLPESQNTLCLFIDRRLRGGFCHAQLKQGELASKICVDSVAESKAFYNREEKRQERQEPLVQASPQHNQHQWAVVHQRKATPPDEPDPSPISLSREQPANRQGVKCRKDSLQSALEDSLQMAPIQAEGCQKTTKTENGVNFPVVPKSLSLEAGNSSPGEFTDIADNDLESDEKSEHELDLYPVGKDSESRSLLDLLQSSDSVTRYFASRRKEKKQALRSKKQTTMSHRYRAMREIKTSDSQTINFRYSNKLNHVGMNDPQQRGSMAGACLEIIHSKVNILSNKERRRSKSRAGKQKIRLGCMQQMQEKSPYGGNAQCLASADVSSSPSVKNNEEEGEEGPERFLDTKKSPHLIRDVHQEKDHGLVKSDTQLNQVGRSLTQGLAAVMLGSLSFSTPTSKESENLEILDKGNEMINSSLTVKTRKEAISQTLIASGCGTPKRGKPMAGSSLNVISPMPVCLDLNTCDEIKETDWKSTMRLSCKLLERSVHNEKAWWTHYMNKDAASNGTEDVQGQGGEEDPLTSQHFSFSVQNMTEPNSTQSGLQQINSATYPELERTLYNGKAQPVNVSSLQSSMVSVMSPLLNTEEPEIGSIPCDNTCDEGPRRKCDYAISEQKAWAEKDLTSLEPLQERSPVSSESKCEGCTLEFSGKKDRSPKARQASRLLHIARSHTRVHRKNRHHKGKQQLRRDECVGEALLYAVEDAESCPLKLPTDELSLDTAARADFSSRRPQRSSAEEKAEFEASLSTTFLRPFDFIIPVLSDFKSQEDTVKLSENKIMLNRRLSTMKKKKISVSKIIKIDGHFITNHKKFKLRAKMKTIWLRENTTGVFQNIIHFLLTNSNVENPFKTEVGLGVSKSTRTQPAHGASPVEGIAECGDSVETVGSNFLKEAKVHVGQCWREKQEVLIEPDPFYMKNLTASAHLMKKPSLEESKRILFREYLPQKSQTYEANPEINVKIEKNNMQVSLKEALSGTKKFHNCPEVSGSTSNTTKHGVKNTGQSSLKEKTSFYLTGIITSIARHLIASKEFKRHLGSMRSPNLSIHKGILSQMKPRESQPPHRDRAAINIKETQGSRTLEIKVDNGEVNTDMNSTSMCVPIKQINMESSQNVWHMYEKSSKGSGLDKAPTKRKEECARLPFGADQRRHPGPFKSDVPSTNTVHGKDSTLQKTAIYLIDQEGNAKVGEEFNQEVVLSSNSHTLQTERQNSEFKTDWKTNSKSFALPENQEKPNVLGPTWSSHASDTTYPEAIRQKDKAKISNVTTTVCAKQIKLKAKKIPVPLLLRNGDSSNKKELGHSMQHQHQNALEQRKMVQNLVLKPNLGLGCFIPPVTKLTSVKLEKGKLGGSKNILPQKILEKPSNQRQKSGSGCVDVPRKREENIKEAHDHCTFKDIHQQFVQQFLVKSEEIKEHHSCKLDNLQRNSEFTSQKNETDNVGLATSRNRGGTKVYIGPQDSLQQEYPLKQGICRQEMIPQTMKEFPHFGMTNKFIQKQDIKTSSLQTIGEMEVMENSLDPKESSLIPRLMVQQQNMFTDPLLGSIPSQVPCQPYIEEPKENMKVSDKLLTNSTPQLKKVSNAEYISDMDHIPRSIEKLLLLIKEQEKRRKRSRRGKNFETAEDIKATMKNPTPFLNNSPPRTQFINTIKNSGVFEQRDGTEPNRSVATLWTQQRSCVQGTSLDYVYTQELTSKVIRHNKRRAAFREGILYHRTIKKKVRKTTLGKLLSIAGYGAHSYRKELRHSIKTQKELPKGKTVADFLWKDFCASGYTASQIKKLREVKEGKGKPQRPSNGTKMLSTQPTDSNSTVSTIRKSVQYTMKQKEQQVLLLDITPQNKDQLMPGQQVEEPRHINLSAHLEKEAYHVVFPETEETDSSTLEAQRPRADTDCEFLTAQRGEQGVRKDFIKHTLSVPPRRGGPEKMNISSSKEHDVFLMELDTFQKETCKMQELFKQGNPSQAGLENDTCPFRESFHLESAKVAKEADTGHSINNISRLFGLRETDPELGSKAQAFLCTDLENLYKTGTAQRGHAKSGHRPRILLNSVPCHKRAPHPSKPSWGTTRKASGATGARMNLKGKGKAESTASPLKLKRQNVDISKKLRAKQLTIFAQNKEQIMEFFLPCILYKLQTENTQKEISTKAALDSKIFNPVLEKAPSEVKILGGHSPSSEGVNLYAKGGGEHPEGMCEPASSTHSLMDMHQITSPQVEKELKTVDSLDCHTLNTEKEEHNDRTKEQNHYHLSFSLKNLEEHLSYSQNDSYVQPHLEPHTKEALLKVGNVSSQAKGPDLSSKAQLSTECECRPEWILPSVILEQSKVQAAELPLESGSKTIKCPSLLSSKKMLSDGVQISKLVSNASSSMPTVSKKELFHRASQKKREVCLHQLFFHCLSLCSQFLDENERQKGNIEYRVMNDTILPERKTLNLKKLVRPHISPNDYTPSNKSELQCYKKEKILHGKDKPGSVVMKAREPIPLPHLKLNKEKSDVLISSDIRREKHKSQEEKNGIKGMDMKGIMDSSITFKTEELSLSYPFSGKKLTLLFDSVEQEGKVQEGLIKSDMKLQNSCIPLPPLLHPSLNSRIKVEKDKSGQLKSCLPLLKPLLSLNSRKVPFSKAFSRDKLCKLIELKYAPQRKEYRNNIVDLKDRISLIGIAQKGNTSPFKYLPHGKEKCWNNKKEPTQKEEKNTVRKDVRDNKIPKLMHQNVKKLAPSHALSMKELQRETQEEKLMDQINTVVALSISQLQLNKFSGAQIVNGEAYNEIKLLKEPGAQKEKEGREKHGNVNGIMCAEDIYSKTKTSPTLLMQNLSDLQGKTREPGGEVEEDGSKPGVTLTQKSSKTSVATSHQPPHTANDRIKKERTKVLRRSSVSLGYIHNSLVSEGGIYIQQIIGGTSISLQNEKQHMSEEKEEAGAQIAKIVTTHTYQETMVQELKDEQVLDLTKSSPLLPGQSHPKLSEKLEFNDTKLRLINSALQRSSTKGETVPREAIVGDTMKDVKKQDIFQREETYQKEIIDRQRADVALKLQKLLLSQKLYRTELRMHINAQDRKSEPQVLRKIHSSQPSPTNIPLCKGVQVGGETLKSTLSSPGAEKIVDKEAMCGHVGKGKQYKTQIENTVGSTAGAHCERAKVSPFSHLLNTKEVVLNMKFLEKKVRKGKSELAVVATRSFLSLPSLPSEDKTQRGTGHSFPQGNFQEAADAQGPATRESAAVDSDCIVKVREYNVLQKSKTVTSARRISEHPQVEMEYESDPKDHKIHLTRLGTIKKEKMLGMSFKGQKGQPEKCEKEPSAKIGHWKKENEFKDNLSNKTSPKFSVSPTKISLKEALVTSDTLACSKRSGAERKEETGSGSFMTSEKDRQSNASLSKMLIPAKMSQNKEEQNVNMEEQAMPQSKSGQLIKSKSFSPNVPVHSKNQRLLLQTDVDKKTAVSIILQAQSGVHMSTTEFNATRRKEDSPSIVQEQEQCDRALPQKSHESPLKSEHLEETHTSSDENLKQTKLEMDSSYSASQKEGALKAGGGRGVALEEDRREMQQRCIFQLGNKAREHTCTTTSHALPPATEKPEIETQVGTARENGYPPQEQLKRELEVCTAKQNVQGQKLLQTSMPNSLYVYIPDYPKSQKSRFAKTNLKRELKPKYLTLRIPKHPISKTLGITGCGSSSRKRKLEYAFNKPKTMVPSSKCTSMISPPHNKGTVELETIPRKEKRVCHPEFQKKLPDARVTKNILTGVKELSKLSMHLVSKATEIKLNQMPEIVNISCQKCNSQPQRTISEDYSCRLHLKHIRTNFTSPKAGTIHNNLESNYQRDFPPFSCVKTMSVSNSSEVMTKAKGIKKRVTSLETGSHILQKFSEKGKDNLLLHFETKALEIKTTSLPRTAAHSYAMASAQDKSKRLFTCIHSTTKEQKRTNRVLVLFDKKSLCEIDRDLQCKYLRSILRPSIPVVSKANGLPKHTYKLDVGSGSECKTVEDRGERLLFDVGLLQHVAFQNKNPRESSFFTRKFQEPPHVLGFSAGLQRTEQNDIMIIPSELKLQMKPEKDKKCHVCFQETSLYKHNIPGTQQNTADLASSYSSGISDDWTTDVPLNTETSTDLVECSASDLAEGPSSDLAEGPSSDLAERPSSDLAERSSSDLAERPSSDLAERSSSDLAERPSSDLAERSSSDLVECPSSDLAECPSSDLKECPSSDLVESPSSDLAERPSSDLAERPSSDLVERPSSDLVESPSSDLAECPSSDLATSDLAKRPSSDLAERPASDLVECPSSDLAERPSSDLAERPSSDLAECPASDLAESPASGLAGHPASDLAERPSSDLAECPASDLAECTSSDLAKRPSSDLAERPSSHLAERPSSHLAECPAFDLVECLASDLVECPSFDPVECPSSDLAECTSSDLAECPASEESDSEECVFIGNNFYSTQGLQKFLFEVPKAISLANLHRVDGATPLKPVYHEDPNDYHTRTHRRHASPVAQPCYQSGNTRKHRLNSKMQSPDGLCHSPSHIVEIESTTSSITVSEGKHQAATTWSRTRYSLTSSATESDTKSNIPKKYGKSYTNPLVKERRKAKSDLWRKFNVDQCSNYRHSHSGEKHGRKKRLYHYESEESNPPTNRMPEPRAHQENIKFYPERRENQPFFYACVPADSMDVIPQTIRWLIPSKILQKSHFHIPQVANISKSWNLCSSSKKLLGSLAEAFNIVRHG